MSLTKIAAKVFLPRQRASERYQSEGVGMQHRVLRHLISRGRHTEYGRNHLLGATRSYDDFAKNVPVNTYEELKKDIDRMRHGEADVLWPGTVRSEEHTSELQSRQYLVCRLLLEKKKKIYKLS